MKVILYMAITANGYIARDDDSTPWSNEEWEAYAEEVKKVDNIIIGLRTYELMKDDGFEKIGNPLVVVVSSKDYANNTEAIFVKTPEEALEVVLQKGFTATTINGGSTLLSSFAQKGLIDEVILDVEPFLFGKGIPLFKEIDAELELELQEARKIGQNGIQLRYSVKK